MRIWGVGRLIGLATAVSLAACGATAQPVVRVSGGEVAPVVGRTPEVLIYKAIPYAAPPVGDLRWRAPQAVKAWTGVRRSEAYSDTCYQEPRTAATGPAVRLPPRPRAEEKASEDCLYLNVWTGAQAKAGDERPVIVWIHGGGFSTGSGSGPTASGDGLAKRGAVVVSMNYRLNVFGFLAHPELQREQGGAAGNYGLLDTVAALQWVKANIAKFGGDPGNITIVGCSSGGGSVVLLMASPQAKGLFHRAIAQASAFSGSPVDLQTVKDASVFAEVLGRDIGAPSLAALRAMPAQDLYRKSMAPRGDAKFPFGPVIDGAFLPADTSTIFAEGRQAKVPLISGCNRDEGVSLAVSIPHANGFIDKRGPKDATLITPGEGAPRQEVVTAWNRFMSRTAHDLARRQSQAGQKAFVYLFEHTPPGTEFAYHCADYIYAMDNLDTAPGAWTDVDRRLAEQLSSYWLNFAKTGDPNGKGLPAWPAYDPRAPKVLVQGDAVEARALADR